MVVCPRIHDRGGCRFDQGERGGRERLRQRDLRGWSSDRARRPERNVLPRVLRATARIASVSAIDGSTLTLVTPDGWSRTVDTTGIPITRGGEEITTADLRVGDRVRVGQRRSDDGTWQVTRLRVALTIARGTVAAVSGDGFEVTTPEDGTLTVRVSEATTWVLGCRVDPAAPLEVGARVVVRGVGAADGSLDATVVAVGRARERLRIRLRGQELPEPGASAAASPGA
jgi:hypothetical protein